MVRGGPGALLRTEATIGSLTQEPPCRAGWALYTELASSPSVALISIFREIAAGRWGMTRPGLLSPLYCYVLGLVYAVAGRSAVAVRIAQAVLGALSCCLLVAWRSVCFLEGRRSRDPAAGFPVETTRDVTPVRATARR